MSPIDVRAAVQPPTLRDAYMVSTCRRPLVGVSDVDYAPVGRSVAQLVEDNLDPVLAQVAVVRVDGIEIARGDWARTLPAEGALVEIGVRPADTGGEGGSDPLRLILTIALVALTVWIGGGGLAFAGLFAAGSASAALLAAGASIIGGYAINAIAPPPQGSVSGVNGLNASPTWYLQAARNRIMLGQPVPKALGKRRMVPPLGAIYSTETRGDEIWLRFLLCWGVGPIAISDLKTGDTPLDNLDGVEIEHALGFADDAPLTLYPRALHEDDVGTVLTQSGGAVRAVTHADAAEISIDVDFGQGLVDIDLTSGDKRARTVLFSVRYAQADSGGDPIGDWYTIRPTVDGANTTAVGLGGERLNLDDFGITIDNWYDGLNPAHPGAQDGNWSITRADNKPFRANTRWAVPVAEHGYVVEITRVTADADPDSGIRDTAKWSILRSIEANPPVLIDNIALTAGVVRASENFNGVLDDLNGIVESVVDRFNGTGWPGDNKGVSRNPADLFIEVATGTANARPQGGSRLKWNKLASWWNFCDTNDLRCDHIVDYPTTVDEVLRLVASTGRARPFWDGPQLSIAIDAEKPIRQAISGRSCRSYRGRLSFPGPLHGIRIPFNNEEKGYLPDERIIYAPGYNASNATNIETVELPGKVRPDEIFTEGVFHLLSALAQGGEAHEIEVDADIPGVTLGERFLFSHDVPLAGSRAGRVRAVEIDGSGDVTAISLDEVVEMESGESYGIRWKTVIQDPDEDPGDDAAVYEIADSLTVSTVVGRSKRIVLPTPTDPADAPAVGDEVFFGELFNETLDLLVLHRDTVGDDGMRIVGIPYAESRLADAGSPPSFSSTVIRGYRPNPPTPIFVDAAASSTGLALDFRYPSTAENPAIRTLVSWRESPPIGADVAYTPLPPIEGAARQVVIPLADPTRSIDVQLIAVGEDGKMSTPLVKAALSPAAFIPDPDNLAVAKYAFVDANDVGMPGFLVTADANTDPLMATLDIEIAPTGTGVWADAGSTAASNPRKEIRGIEPLGRYDFRARFRTVRGDPSDWVTISDVQADEIFMSGDTRNVGGRSAAEIFDDFESLSDAVFRQGAGWSAVQRYLEDLGYLDGEPVGVAIVNEEAARITADAVEASARLVLAGEVDDNAAAIIDEVALRVSGDSANASSILALTTEVDDQNAVFINDIDVLSTASDAYGSNFSLLGAANGGGTAWIINEDTVESGTRGTMASVFDGLSVTTGGHTTSISLLLTAMGTQEARAALEINVDGVITGIEIDGIAQAFILSAAAFEMQSLTDGGDEWVPFAIDGTSGAAIFGDTIALVPGENLISISGLTQALSLGAEFGVDDLLFWFGAASVDPGDETKANATIWMDGDGDAFFGGAIAARYVYQAASDFTETDPAPSYTTSYAEWAEVTVSDLEPDGVIFVQARFTAVNTTSPYIDTLGQWKITAQRDGGGSEVTLYESKFAAVTDYISIETVDTVEPRPVFAGGQFVNPFDDADLPDDVIIRLYLRRVDDEAGLTILPEIEALNAVRTR